MAPSSNLSFKQQGNGYPVILLHGFCESKEIWNDFSKDLIHSFRLIIPDLPGFGESVNNKNCQSVEAMAEEVYQLLQSLHIAQCIIVAHSLGGYVALALAEKYRDTLKGLCLFHSTAFADSEEKKHTRNKTADFIIKNGVAAFAESFVPPLFFKGQRDALANTIEEVRQIVIQTPQETAVAVTKAMRDRPERTKVLQEAAYPIMFIAGKEDEAVPLNTSKEQFFMPQYSIVHLLSNSAHMGMFEHPKETGLAVEQFCNLCLALLDKA